MSRIANEDATGTSSTLARVTANNKARAENPKYATWVSALPGAASGNIAATIKTVRLMNKTTCFRSIESFFMMSTRVALRPKLSDGGHEARQCNRDGPPPFAATSVIPHLCE